METIEKIRRYIDRTRGSFTRGTPYQMNFVELFALSQLSMVEALCLAFDYGRAKGYRAAKKEARA